MKVVLEQNPIAKARHRHFQRGSKSVTFDPQSKDVERTRLLVLSKMLENGLNFAQDGALHMNLTLYTPIPKSWSRKRQNSFDGKPCLSRPDLDNYIKFYADVLNGLAYHDDKQITSLCAEKVYSSKPRVEIVIEQIREN